MKSGWLVCIALGVLYVAVGLHPVRAATLFGLADTGELFVSSNRGATWTVRSTVPVSDAVAIGAGESSDELFMATRSGLIFRSSDGGENWTSVGAVTANDVVDMAIRTNGDIYLLSEKGTLWLSVDNGVTFTPIATLMATNFVSLSGDVGGGNLYALTETGEVARSTNFGSKWGVVGAITTPDAVALRAVGQSLYVLTATGDVAKSTDNGATWMVVGTVSQVHMAGLTTNSIDLVAASKEGLIATSEDAVSWNFAGSINQLTIVAIGNDTPRVTGIGDPTVVFSPLNLRALWPNPARGSVDVISVEFELGRPSLVALRVYDVRGRLVGMRVAEAYTQTGEHTLQWNPDDLPSGVYFVRLVTASGLETQAKLTIIR